MGSALGLAWTLSMGWHPLAARSVRQRDWSHAAALAIASASPATAPALGSARFFHRRHRRPGPSRASSPAWAPPR